MQKAQKRDACLKEKFWFRKDIITPDSPPEANKCCKSGSTCDPTNCDVYTPMTVNQIINGKVDIISNKNK